MSRIAVSIIVLAVAAVTACSSDGGDDALSPLALEGRQVARDEGCAACHGQDGEGTVGPAWVDLAGSQVTLTDGSTVIADRAYLRASIVDPSAQRVDGYTIEMPVVDLTPRQVDAVIAYIEELG